MIKRLVTSLLLAGSFGLNATAATTTFALDDIPKLVGVSNVAISPDGKQIAFVVSRENLKTDKNDATLELYDLATKTTRPLSFERTALSSPAWSPDGTKLAFLADYGSGDDTHQQIWIMDMRGGDPIAVTKAPEGVMEFAWRPDGGAIAYVAPDEPSNKKDVEEHRDWFVVGDQAYDDRAAPTSNHIWLLSLGADGTAASKRLTHGTWSLPSAQPPSSPGPPLSWSPDGKTIVFTKMPNAYDADSDGAIVCKLDVASGTITPLTSHGKYEGFGEFSPDGAHVAYWYPRDGDEAAVNEVYVAPASGGDGSDVTSAVIDTNVQRFIWMPDSKSLLISGHKDTDSALWIKPLDGVATRIDLHGVQPSAFFWLDASVAKTGAIAFVGSEPGHPVELYYMSSASAVPQRLTGYNDAIAALDLGAVRAISWQNEGYSEDGVVTLPPSFDKLRMTDPDHEYPLVLVIHGGPNSASVTSFNALDQVLAARGYIVFNPNYRGSDNLGAKYWYGIINDSGAGPGRDVMAGIAAVEQAYKIDRSRIAVSGWSYGGYMTSWMIGHYHIWKAAVSGAAVNDLIDEYALADNGVGDRYQMGGYSPYVKNQTANYIAQSPISAAWDVTTPTLILSDVGDQRVPITQSYKFYHALKDRGTTVQFWAYPVSGHFPGDPVRQLDVYRRWSGWIERYLK
ncbi:MAG TPA: S9 family peptidase [Candidatus Acidoferrales bacterium]|nr:S9 family peptidase [Candidatus Acidoferrales bacterium]